jgi:hypothetical protein
MLVEALQDGDISKAPACAVAHIRPWPGQERAAFGQQPSFVTDCLSEFDLAATSSREPEVTSAALEVSRAIE